MMLRADKEHFVRAVDKLYTVTRLKARLAMQDCPDAPISMVKTAAAQHQPAAAAAPAVAPVAAAAPRAANRGGGAAPLRSGQDEPSRLRAQIAAGSEKIQKRQAIVARMDSAIGVMQGRMGGLQRKMQALREQMHIARA